LKNKSGELLQVIDRFDYLEYVRSENEVGYLKTIIPNAIRDYYQKNFVIEVWRKIPGSRPYIDMDTEWRLIKSRSVEKQGGAWLDVFGQDSIGLLDQVRIYYFSGTDYTEKSGAAGSLMREFVLENAGGDATDANRWESGGFDSDFFRVEADQGLGASVTPNRASGAKLLTILQQIASQSEQLGSRIFFDVVRIDNNLLEFQTFAGQRGVDHGPDSGQEIVLSTLNGTLEEASHTEDHTDSYNAVAALGGGQGTSRTVSAASSSDAGGGPFDRAEAVYDARTVTVQATLDNLANEALARGQKRIMIEAKLVDTAGLRYGVHYNYGDRVTVVAGGQKYAARIGAMQVVVENGEEKLRAALRVEND
jgi:hypothetical protein